MRPADRGYIAPLDGLRAIAALAVLFFHLHLGFGAGGVGVDVFFVLSGFLITGILLRSALAGGIRFGSFYIRRALRLLPAYLAVLVLALILGLLLDLGGTVRGAISSFFYVSNWILALDLGGLGPLGHTWSLAIEEQFYLVWPLLLTLLVKMSRGRPGALLAWTLGVFVLCWLTIPVALALGAGTGFVWNATPSRGMELAAGAVLAVAFAYYEPERRMRRALQIAGPVALAGILVLLWFPVGGDVLQIVLGWPLISLLTVVVIASATVAGPAAAILGFRPLVAVGKASYGLYLWHFPILEAIDSTLGLEHWGAKLLGIALTAIVVPLSYFFLEQPFLRLKDRLAPRGRRTVPPAAPATTS